MMFLHKAMLLSNTIIYIYRHTYTFYTYQWWPISFLLHSGMLPSPQTYLWHVPCWVLFSPWLHIERHAALGALGHGASRLDFFQSVANSDRIGPCSRQPRTLKMLLTTRRFGAQSNLSHIESLEILENPHWLQAYLAELPGLGLNYRTYHSQMKSK